MVYQLRVVQEELVEVEMVCLMLLQVVEVLEDQMEQLTPEVEEVEEVKLIHQKVVDQVLLLLEHQDQLLFLQAPGTNTVTTLPAPAGGCKVATFTVSGTLTVS
jgi:hypothetical protein